MTNKQFYNNSVREFGISAQGVHWNSKYTQYKRFEIITKLIKKYIKNSSIIDVGCGFGEYYNYLIKNNRTPQNYIGIDCEQEMIITSKKRFSSLDFYTINILHDDIPQADYLISSGALNLLTFNEIEVFIYNCFNNSKYGFIFNFLKDITFNNIKQSAVINICKKHTDNLIIKEGYLENDFTIFMVKSSNTKE